MKELFYSKESKHSIYYQIAMMIFIVSLGLGDRFSLFGIRLVYLTTAIVFLLSMLDKRPSFNSFRNNHYKKIIMFGIVWVVYPVVTLPFLKDMPIWLTYYKGIVINFVIVWLIVRYINDKEDWNHLAKSCGALLIISLLVGAVEIITQKHLITDEFVYAFLRQPLTFYNNINDSAVMFFLLFYICLIHYAYNWKNIKNKIVFPIIAVITFGYVVLLQCRSAVLGYVVLAIFTLYFALTWKLEQKLANRIFWICVVTVVTIAVILLAVKSPTYYFGLISTEKDYLKSDDYISDVFRIGLLVDAFKAFLGTYGIGLGPGQSIFINNIQLHFFYLEVLVDYGIIVGGYFLWNLLKLGGNKIRLESRITDALVNSVFFVFLIIGVATSKFFITRPVWVVIALIFSLEYGEFDSCTNNYYVR